MNALDSVVRPLKMQASAADLVRRVHALLARRGVHFPVRLWDGAALGPEDSAYRLVVHHPWSLRAVLVPPTDRAAGEAYVLGDIDVEGSMVAALADAAALRESGRLTLADRAAISRAVLSLPAPPPRGLDGGPRLSGGRHTKKRDAQAVRYHYDVSNDFYALFLDANLVYSCAYFSDEDARRPVGERTALERAQVRKLDLVCRKLHLREGDRLLDIGCGWGSLVLHAARHYGVRALGVTLSPRQATLAAARIREAGLEDRVDVRVQDYRDVRGSFDAVASIGMFEHVGERRFTTYFDRIRALTAPGGRFLNHAITTGRRGRVRDLSTDRGSFAGAHVFPDGALAPAHVPVELMERAGFEVLDLQQLRPHYERTLRHWLANLEGNAAAARAEVGEPLYRTWRAYLAGSVVGFASNDLGVVQVLGVKGPADLPLGRAWMEPTMP